MNHHRSVPRAGAPRPRPARGWRGRLRTSRGVALVEAAFVTPVFFMLVLAVVEGGLYMNDYLGVSSSVRAGARAASANGAVGKADMYTLLNISHESAALDNNQIQYVVIYKATGFGAKPNATCLAGTSQTGVCNVYYPADIKKALAQVKEESLQEAAEAAGQTRTLDTSKIWFGCLIDGPHANQSPDRYWCPGSRVDTRSGNNKAGPDYVGVYIKAKHAWVTKMFGSNTTISDRSVIQIEPRAE